MRNIHRREVLSGVAGLALAGRAIADDEESPVAHGVLANNELAKAFRKAPRELPDVTLIGAKGEFHADILKGRTILMPLWAEWCAPCLSELPDFARLKKKYANNKFTIVPVLTDTRKKLTPQTIAEIFAVLHAGDLPPVMEAEFGNRLMQAMAREGRGYAIPCNLLIAPDGTVVGREMGKIPAADAADGAAPEKTKDAETVTRAIHGQAQSLWGKAEGEEFAAAMANGFLA
jgi:thiol-disulfide isomerase/thioredoxin